jgi:hypothetical protein
MLRVQATDRSDVVAEWGMEKLEREVETEYHRVRRCFQEREAVYIISSVHEVGDVY